MKTLVPALALVLVVLTSPVLNACETYSSQFTTAFRNDINGDLNDLGRIFQDAGNYYCAESAMLNLTWKVESMLANPVVFTRWLDGYYVGLIYGAAFRLGEQGWATTGLDEQLDYNPWGRPTVAGRFTHFTGTPPSGGCGLNTWNTCMDDHAGSAFGYAWMAAYKTRRMNHNSWNDVLATRNAAASHIAQAFDSVCLRKLPITTSGSPVCNGTIAELVNGTAVTLSVNGTQQLPHYGFGLMTSIFSAMQALEIVGVPYAFRNTSTANDVAVAIGLFEEIRRHADQYGNFDPAKPCVRPGANGAISADASCAGPDNYQPNLYNLWRGYQYFLNYAPSTGYKSNTFNSGLYQMRPNTPYYQHFSYGRYTGYFDMGYWWLHYGAPDFPGDYYDPIGYFEGISPTGVAQGWACDEDVQMRQGRIKVDFYTEWTHGWNFIIDGWAEHGSEQVINNLCRGGYAHRFWVQLPAWTQGIPIRAYGIDFTWADSAELPCLQSPNCSW